jgi:pimeloyl-ACP methyl ester carboxylesterase
MHTIERHILQAVIGAVLLFLLGSSASVGATETARTLAVSARAGWVDTGLTVSLGDRISVSATGLVSIGCNSCPDQQSPDGKLIRRSPSDDRPFLAPGLHLWSLVGKIGSSRPFEIGAGRAFVAPASGALQLGVNDNSFADNSGQWTASIKIARASAQLFVLSPFRLNAPDLSNIDLSALLPTLDLTAAGAAALAADSTSAAIALWETSARSDVTFTTNNGTTLAAYAANFLTHAPTAGPQSLTVPGADLIAVGGKFYATALVQAPARGVARSFTDPATITASQAHLSPGQAFLDLKLPPVLFIHGLWGDKDSLKSTKSYLANHSPWNEDTGLLLRIEYPKNLRFDAAPISAIVADGVEALLASADTKRIVVGRVDVVGHSMGGLVVRHYSDLSLYRAPRDRGQGQFHALTTLDTPQLGSALARFLLNHKDDKEQAPTFSEPAAVWLAACGSFSETVAECFDGNDMPLLGPGDVVRGGSVWSVLPSSKSLDNAPTIPSIAGLIWADITSVVRSSDDSQLRYIISNLIKAIYSDPDDAPSPSDILGGPNDVIVSFKSQASDSTDQNRIEFLGLDHTVLRFDGFALNNAVNNSNKVSKSVACWFQKEGDSSCVPPGPIEGDVRRIAEAGTSVVPTLTDRLVTLPEKAEVGVPLSVTGLVNSKGVRRVAVYQKNDAGKKAAPEAEEEKPFSFSGNRLHFQIIPRLPGRVTFEVDVTLADGSKLVQRIMRNVTIRDDMLQELHGHASNQVFLFRQLGKLGLAPFGIFKNVEEEVPLDGYVDYSIESAGNPVVRVEDDALVPLRPGTARILARLGSKTDRLKVTVKQ